METTHSVGKLSPAHPRHNDFGGPKKEIVITGLPETDENKTEALALRLMSTTLMPRGRAGSGRGAEGIRYYYKREAVTRPRILETKPTIEWVEAEQA